MKDKKKIIEEAKQIDYDEEGNAIISIGLKTKEDFYDPFCDKTYKLLNSGMLEFIDKSSKSIPVNEKLAIEISTETKLTKAEVTQMKDAIKRQYAEELLLTKKKLNINLIASLILTIVGIGVLALGILFENLKILSLITDTIIIAAWVFEWEAFYLFFLERPKIRHKYKTINKLFNSKITIHEYK